jgi:glycosyltransferase involved in cell wall biosynthesis
MKANKKLLILITAYNVENFIKKVIDRIPHNLLNAKYNYQILIIDDNSRDKTKEEIKKIKFENNQIKIKCLFNKSNQGYGGNQKIGYRYAIKYQFDYVLLLHGDGQYAPEKILDMLLPFETLDCDAVQGSRMINKLGALKGGMPLYKFIGNIFLTHIQNLITKIGLSEFHSGYRAYKVKSLMEIPFELNSNYFHFDTEILIQLKILNKKIFEISIPTYYGKEISSLKSIHYGFAILKTTLKYYCQRYSIFYERKYDLNIFSNLKNRIHNDNFILSKTEGDISDKYVSKLDFNSTHSVAYSTIEKNSKVLSLGCGYCHVEKILKEKKNCYVYGVDNFINNSIKNLDLYEIVDLNFYNFDFKAINYDVVLLLDVIEHLYDPENFLKLLNDRMSQIPKSRLLISTPNIANIFIRFMLLFGYFNYGKKGILDRTHTRLFTKDSIIKILEENNFKINSISYIPIPLPLVIKNKFICNFFMSVQKYINIFFGKLFSFQIFIEAKAYPNLDYLIVEGDDLALQSDKDTNNV